MDASICPPGLCLGTQAAGSGSVFGLDHDFSDDQFQHLDALRDASGSSRGESPASNRRIHLRPLHDRGNVLQTLLQWTLFYVASHGQVRSIIPSKEREILTHTLHLLRRCDKL